MIDTRAYGGHGLDDHSSFDDTWLSIRCHSVDSCLARSLSRSRRSIKLLVSARLTPLCTLVAAAFVAAATTAAAEAAAATQHRELE